VQINYFLALPKILLLAMMLQHLQFPSFADQIEQTMLNVFSQRHFFMQKTSLAPVALDRVNAIGASWNY
jgi:hypothetical protein